MIGPVRSRVAGAPEADAGIHVLLSSTDGSEANLQIAEEPAN